MLTITCHLPNYLKSHEKRWQTECSGRWARRHFSTLRVRQAAKCLNYLGFKIFFNSKMDLFKISPDSFPTSGFLQVWNSSSGSEKVPSVRNDEERSHPAPVTQNVCPEKQAHRPRDRKGVALLLRLWAGSAPPPPRLEVPLNNREKRRSSLQDWWFQDWTC